MRLLLALVALLGAPALPRPQAPDDRDAALLVEHQALRAVEGDSAAALSGRWRSRLARDPRDRLAALGLATLSRDLYDYPDADRRYGALYDVSPTDAIARRALIGAGWAADIRGAPLRADSLFVRARRDAHAAHDPVSEGEALVGLTIGRASTLGVPVGLALLDTADRLLRGADGGLLAESLGRRALLYAVTSDPRADATAKRALAFARSAGNRRAESRVLSAMASAQRSRQAGDSAAATLLEVQRLQTDARDYGGLSTTLLRRADLYESRGELGLVKQLVEQAMAAARRSHNDFGEAAALTGLGSVDLATRDYAAARVHLAQSAERYDAMHDSASRATVAGFEAQLALATGDLARARDIALGYLRFHRRTHDESAQYDILRTLAAIDRRRGELDSARRDIAEAVTARHGAAWDRELSVDRGAVALAAGDNTGAMRWLARYVAGADTADHIARHAAREMLALAAARAGDLARAEREMTVAANELDAWRGTLTDRQLRVFAFQAWSHDAEMGDPPAPAVIAALATGGRADAAFTLAERRRARELADALTRAAALAGQASPASPASSSPRRERTAAPVTAASLAPSVVGPSVALLEYVTGAGAPTTLFIVSRAASGGAGVRAVLLPSADSLSARVARLDALLESGGAARAETRALGQSLLDPALASLAPAVQRLVVVPDGPLHRVPFDALRMANGRVAVERYDVALAPSAAVALSLAQRAAPAPSGDERLLAVGDPVSASPLPAARDEVHDVARFADDATVLVGSRATPSALRRAPLASFDVLHFATHALVDDAVTARTALALAPEGGDPGTLTPGDIAALPLRARLVVLSACRTARGVVVDGEGVQGLTAPFLQAGARSVVATQWKVDDRATARLVHAFYAAMADGRPVGDALRDAKLDAMRHGRPPRDWAAFTLVGDASTRVPLHRPAWWRVW